MNKDKNAAIDLLNDWMPRLFVGLAILVASLLVLIFFGFVYQSISNTSKMRAVISSIANTDAGKYAGIYFTQCHDAGFFPGPNELCAQKVVDSARALRGGEFAEEVAASVEKILEVVK